ncbi:MAG: 4Fe-4S binding protein, partial [Nitrospirae bacterium]|nr:4Fe-4S binding protein [Nitrospirota bacterium]
MTFEPIIIISISIVLIWTIQSILRKKKDNHNLMKLETARKEGLTEPPSLHPVIDPDLCIGSGSCISACPEGDVLGLIKGKAA